MRCKNGNPRLSASVDSLGFLLLQRFIFCRVLDIRVPEIVIPDLSHSLCLEQFRKTLCDVVGLDQIANLIDTYILKITLFFAGSCMSNTSSI